MQLPATTASSRSALSRKRPTVCNPMGSWTSSTCRPLRPRPSPSSRARLRTPRSIRFASMEDTAEPTATAWLGTCACYRTLTTVSASPIPASTGAGHAWAPMRVAVPRERSAAILERSATMIPSSRNAHSRCLRPAPCPAHSAAPLPQTPCRRRASLRPLRDRPSNRSRWLRRSLPRRRFRSASTEATAWRTVTASPATNAAFRVLTTASAFLTRPSTAQTARVWPTTGPSARILRSAATLDPSAEEDRIDSVLHLQHLIVPIPLHTLPSRRRRDRPRVDLVHLISSANTAAIAVLIASVFLETNAFFRIRTSLNVSQIHLSTRQVTLVYPTTGTVVTRVPCAAIPGQCAMTT